VRVRQAFGDLFRELIAIHPPPAQDLLEVSSLLFVVAARHRGAHGRSRSLRMVAFLAAVWLLGAPRAVISFF